MPTAPSLGRGKHATSSAHVSVSTLAGAVSTTTTDTGDTSHGAAGTPRFSARLMTYKVGEIGMLVQDQFHLKKDLENRGKKCPVAQPLVSE